MRRQCKGLRRNRVLENDPLAGNRIDIGSGLQRITITTQVVGTARIYTYQQNMANLRRLRSKKIRFFRIMRRYNRCSERPRKIVRGPRGENFPPPAQIYASAQTIFLSRQPQGADLSSPPMHYPDEAKIPHHNTGSQQGCQDKDYGDCSKNSGSHQQILLIFNRCLIIITT